MAGMKQLSKRFSLGIAFFLCLSLCACAATKPVAERTPSPETDSSQGLPEKTEALNGTPYELVLSCDTTVYGSGNENGFYQVTANEDGTFLATFIDYRTKQQVYLCSDASCSHNSESCTAWFPAGDLQIWPIACDEGIFFVHNSTSGVSCLEYANPDGSGRKQICTLNSGETFESGAAYRPGYLVLMIDGIYQQGDNPMHTDRLEAIEIATGARTTLFETVPAESQASRGGPVDGFFQGVTDSGLIVKTIQSEADLPTQTQTVYLIPFDGSEPRSIASFQTGEMSGLPHGDAWYFLKADPDLQTTQLGCIDTATGRERILVDDLSEIVSVDSFGDLFIRTFVDDWIILNAMTSMSVLQNQNIQLIYSCYAIHQNSGEIRELELSNYYHATQVPIDIYGECGDGLLVEAAVEEVKNPDTVMTQLNWHLALLKKEDYLSSRPNFDWIAML